MKINLTIFLIILFYSPSIYSQSTWAQKANFGGQARVDAIGFSIGTKGYIGTGRNSNTAVEYVDFWEYDPSTNSWTQKADFGGGARHSAVGFSVNNKGYVGTGVNVNGPIFFNDFWEYDPLLNIWNQRASFGGSPRYDACGFAIGSNGYIGTGYDGTWKKDFWQYNTITDSWVQKTDFGGVPRYEAASFSIGANGYIGTGENNITPLNDFWKYDTTNNSWTQIANFAGVARWSTVSFALMSKGYVGAGVNGSSTLDDIWSYSPFTDTWNQVSSFGGGVCHSGVGFSIGNKGYSGTGNDATGNRNDFWEFQSSISSSACDTLYYSTTNNTYFGQTIKSTDGNIVSVGTENHLYNWSNGDIYLSKYDTSFNLIWSRKFYVGGGMDVAGGLLATSDGGYLIHSSFGNSNAAGNFSAGYIIKTDSAGNQQWVQTLTGQSYGDNYSSAAVENSQGEFICYGYVQHHSGCSSYATRITKLSSSGSIVWSNCIQLNPDWSGGITKLTSSDIYITAFNNANNGTIELRKWDDSGNQIGLVSYQYNNLQFTVGAVRSCLTGGYFVYGRYNSTGNQKNAFIAKFDDSMNFLWEASDSTYEENHFYTLAEDSQGNIFCTARINDVGQPGDLLVTQFNSSGVFQNKGIFGSPTSDDLAQGIVTLSNGDIICSGRSDSQGLLVKFCGLGSNTTGMSDNLQHQNQLTLFPNPASEFMHLTFDATNLKPYKISIYNLSGQRVFDKIFETSVLGPQQMSVGLKDYQNGLYFIRLEGSDIMLSQKFMIVH